MYNKDQTIKNEMRAIDSQRRAAKSHAMAIRSMELLSPSSRHSVRKAIIEDTIAYQDEAEYFYKFARRVMGIVE